MRLIRWPLLILFCLLIVPFAQAADAEQVNILEQRMVSTGDIFTCALETDGSLGCWGNLVDQPAPTFQPMPIGGTYTQVSVGGAHACAIRTDQTLVCWGGNLYMQSTPPSGTFEYVMAAFDHSCGIRTDGTAVCWGFESTAPDVIFTQIEGGLRHTCALATDQTITCWGTDIPGYGTLNPPTGTFKQISSLGAHSCAIRTDDTIACWGDNRLNQSNPPAGTFAQVSAGGAYACALDLNDRMQCWGDGNFFGQAIALPEYYTQVSTGGSHNCALRVDGVIVCWGSNTYDGLTVPAPFNQPDNRIYPASGGIITDASEWPRFSFNAMPGVEWYQVWVGTADYTTTSLFEWFPATDVIGAPYNLDGICVDDICTLPRDLWLANGDYAWWITYWGPDYPYTDFYWNAGTFSVDVPPPATTYNHTSPTGTVTNAPVELLWPRDANTLWYQLWLGSADYTDTLYFDWVPAVEICDAENCILDVSDDAFPAGDYAWWMEAWGPGGYTTWNDAADNPNVFTVGTNGT